MGHSLQEAEASCRTPITEQQPILNLFKLPSTLRMKYLFVIVVIACAVAVANADDKCSVCKRVMKWAADFNPEYLRGKAEVVCKLPNVRNTFPNCTGQLVHHGSALYKLLHTFSISQYCQFADVCPSSKHEC